MMMKVCFFAFCIAATMTAWGDVDLTPTTASITMGKFAVSRLQFVDGDKKIAISLDSDAEVSAANGGARVGFKSIPGASVTIHPSPLSVAVPFEGEGLIQYQKAALRMLPASAESVVQDEAAVFSESIGGGQSYRFVFSYSIAGSPMRESIAFLNISPTQQIVFQTGSFLKDFGAASARAVNMIRDWHRLLPAEEHGLN